MSIAVFTDYNIILRWAKVRDGAVVRGDERLPPFDEDTPKAGTIIRERQVDDDGAEIAPRIVSPGITEKTAAAAGWFPVDGCEPPVYDSWSEELSRSYVFAGGKVICVWKKVALTNAVIAERIAAFNARQIQARQIAFREEYDPLVGAIAAGELKMGTKELAAVRDGIRTRYPYR